MIPHEISRSRIASWMRIARVHDVGLYRHSVFVAHLACAFSRHLGFSLPDQRELVRAALLHDIGKVELPRELLCKPSELTADELTQMRLHPETGYRMLLAEGGHSPEVLSVVRQHHERLDGSGYPYGIRAVSISEPVRIVTLCDIYAAMTEVRPYAPPFTRDAALERMATKRSRIDPGLLQHFSSMLQNFVYVFPPMDALDAERLLKENR